eukprot:TRINITY_DN2786_c0_g1_i1.p1 TRINITY_DN2786_c0_g1~~TRINITY_DN2786_c0_g1_i1.p1  ORF type:complete len:416 (+),score=97.64 TRINITY_DN2786_c0_g1_i1:9-1256(+)
MSNPSSLLTKGNFISLPTWGTILKVTTTWHIKSKSSPDIDISCVIFGHDGNILDAVYYNQLVSKDGAISHSGDIGAGQNTGIGHEEILIRTNMIHPQVKMIALLVNCFNNGSFADISEGKVRITDAMSGDFELVCFPLDHSGNGTASIIACIFKDDTNPIWSIKNINQPGSGRNFMESEPLIRREFEQLQGCTFQQANEWNISSPTFNLEKGNSLVIQDRSVSMGLGWDMSGDGVDLDASALCYGIAGRFMDLIYFRKLESADKSIQHLGDNRTGEGDGDDETIVVNLQKLHPEVVDIFCVVTIYNGAATFKSVKNSYCRMVDRSTEKEIFKYKLKEFENQNGVVFTRITRQTDGTSWRVTAVGDSVQAQHPTALVPLIQTKYLNVSPDAVTNVPIPPLPTPVIQTDRKRGCYIL